MKTYERAHVLVCGGTGCRASGSGEVMPMLAEQLEASGLSREIRVIETGCHGLCQMGPLVIVYPEGVFYVRVTADDVKEIVETHLLKGRVVDRLLYKEPNTQAAVPSYSEIGFYKKQYRYALANCGHINPESLHEYIAVEGYEGLAKALTMEPQEVVAEIIASGLRGRGGGGFPTGIKWQIAQNAGSAKKYVVCNADEGDPGAFMDRAILEGDPHRIVEGMANALTPSAPTRATYTAAPNTRWLSRG